MNHKRPGDELVLAIFPSTRGFGYAVLEGPTSLLDWGVKGARGGRKNTQSLQRARDLLRFYRPDVLVLEDYEGRSSRRATRIQKLIDAMNALAAKDGVATVSFSRAEVRACFSSAGVATKRHIAQAIVREFPELEPRLPPVRKIWMSEDVRMNIFDAAALAMTFFDTQSRPKRAA